MHTVRRLPLVSSRWHRRRGTRALLLTCILVAVALWLARPTRADFPYYAFRTYLPVVQSDHLPRFGAEPVTSLNNPERLQQATDLPIGMVRLNGRVVWRTLQPTADSPIQWHLLAPFEQELVALRRAGLEPVIVVHGMPDWATVAPGACRAIRQEAFPAFADFMAQLVARYRNDPYHVQHWELINEPDVDPRLVPPDSPFGCWGNRDDPYYNGEHYGAMLKAVVPAMRAAHPQVRVWSGGLLLEHPSPGYPDRGEPQQFFRGILVAGAAPMIDVVSYHAYVTMPPRDGTPPDPHYNPNDTWYAWGGNPVGKARYLKAIMQEYGINKPLYINEGGAIWYRNPCPEPTIAGDPPCYNPDRAFAEWQASILVRQTVRALSEPGVMGISFYTLEGRGWRYGGLYGDPRDVFGTPKPAYRAYQHLIAQIGNRTSTGTVSYGTEVEGYRFHDDGTHELLVLWSRDEQYHTITTSQSRFVAAYSRDGALLMPSTVGNSYALSVGFSPVYVVQRTRS